jgi:hypothetical protein
MSKTSAMLLAAFLALSCSVERETSGESAALNDAGLRPPESLPQVVPRGDRLLGVDILDLAAEGTFQDNIQRARALGAQFISLHTTWTQFETSPGVLADPHDLIRTFIDVLQAHDLKLALTVRPIDLTGKTVPSDLRTTRFRDPVMIQRFQDLLAFLFALTGSDGSTTLQVFLTSLQVGNEIDEYDSSSEHPDFWSDYGRFLFETNRFVGSQISADIPVGFTGTLRGLVEESSRPIFQALAGAVDVVGVTYYPMNSQFQVEDPSVVAQDLQDLVDAFPGRTLYLQEVGYPTSSANASDPDGQADYFRSLFLAWDTHRQTIPLVNIVRLQDVSRSTAEGLAGEYGSADEGFVEYLRTFGLRTHPGGGADKPAYQVVREEAIRRGWSVSAVPPQGIRIDP